MHFIRWALTKEQGKRPSVQQLAEHPWIVSHMKPRPAAPGEGIRRAIGRTGRLSRAPSQTAPRSKRHRARLAEAFPVHLACRSRKAGRYVKCLPP